MSETVFQSLVALPESGLTVQALQVLDKFVPGAWSNERSAEAMVAAAAGIPLPPRVYKSVRTAAKELDPDGSRYRRAIAVYELADKVDQLAAGATVVGKVGGALGQLGKSIGGGLGDVLGQLTPKPAATQTIDAGLKLCAEVVAFGLLNGAATAEGGMLKRFAGALEDYARYDLMRIAAWVVFDGLIPLGPHFLERILDGMKGAATSKLAEHEVFSELSDDLPGKSADEKRAFVVDAVDTAGDFVARLVEERELTQEGALREISGALSIAQAGGEVVAAAIDASTRYFAHTGTQTVARTLVRHALAQSKEQVWEEFVERHQG